MAFALGVQALFALLLLWSLVQPTSPRLARETILLLRHPARLSPPSVIDARIRAPSSARSTALPARIPPAPASSQAAPALPRLGDSLENCAPETLDRLTPQALAQCRREGRLVQPWRDDLLHNPPSQSKDAAHWAAGLARRKDITVPCTHIATIAGHDAAQGKTLYVPMFDPLCAAGRLLNGAGD